MCLGTSARKEHTSITWQRGVRCDPSKQRGNASTPLGPPRGLSPRPPCAVQRPGTVSLTPHPTLSCKHWAFHTDDLLPESVL
eukprot:3928131-Amphidinium_carterae.4